MDRAGLIAALGWPNVQAFLRVIRAGESSQDDSAYTEDYGGGHFDAPPWEHPRAVITAHGIPSTASGAYQFLARTWDGLVKKYGFEDFSPENQDQGAVGLIAGRGALQDVIEGRFREALARCALEWASLPGSPYGQPTRTYAQALAVYTEYGGTLAPQAATQPLPASDPPEVKPMPIFMALLPLLSQLVPQIGSLFGSGSEVQQRNVAAASIITKALTDATGSPNLQAAVEAMQSDPAALKAGQAAVADVWPSLTESGGGGIDGARKAAAAPDQLPFWKNGAFVIALVLAPLIYMVAVEILFNLSGQVWSDDIKTMFVTSIVAGLLGSITGFFLGSSLGSQKKDAALAAK